MSILVMTTSTGTFNARAIPRCSLHAELSVLFQIYKVVGAILAHADQPIVGGDHEKTVIRAAAKQSKHSSAKIPLMAS
jgi:hypothetical protein